MMKIADDKGVITILETKQGIEERFHQKAEEIDSLNKRIEELESSLKKQEQDHKMNIQQLEI